MGFRTAFSIALAAAIYAAHIGHPARADGVMLPDSRAFRAMRERALIEEPEQKAVIVFRDGVEDLVISPRFAGSASRFAWVIPVPSRPSVGKLDGALFHELERVTLPVMEGRGKSRSAVEGVAAGGGVEVLERKQVGAYDVAVLKADDSHALVRWLKTNRFAIPPSAEAPIRAHIKDRWTFVAARVNVPRAEGNLRRGTLAPIRLTFRARQPIYPLRLSAANPKPFRVLAYVIAPAGPEAARQQVVFHNLRGNGARPLAPLWFGVPSARNAPTLAKLVQGPVTVHRWSRTYEPRACVADLRFSMPRVRSASSGRTRR